MSHKLCDNEYNLQQAEHVIHRTFWWWTRVSVLNNFVSGACGKLFIWGGKSSVLWLEISFYKDLSVELWNAICTLKTHNLPNKIQLSPF